MAERNSRGILKFNNGEGQKLLKMNYSVSLDDVDQRISSNVVYVHRNTTPHRHHLQSNKFGVHEATWQFYI